jgi:hypothetical protein
VTDIFYLVDVWIFPRVGQDVERRVEDVEHPHDFHDSAGVGIASAQVANSNGDRHLHSRNCC